MAVKELPSKAIRFPFAGRFTIFLQEEDGTDTKDPNGIYTPGRNIVDNINFARDITTEELNDGNSLDPAAIYYTGQNSTVNIVLNSEDPDADIFLKGSKKTLAENVPVWHPDLSRVVESGKITLTDGSGNPVKIDDSGKWPIVVKNFSDHSPLTEATGPTPSAGEFSVDPATGEFTFDSSDEGARVFISCAVIVDNATIYTESSQPNVKTFKVVVSGPAEDYSGNNPMYVTYEFDSMQVADGGANMPHQKGTAQKTISLRTTRSRLEDAVTVTYAPRAIEG